MPDKFKTNKICTNAMMRLCSFKNMPVTFKTKDNFIMYFLMCTDNKYDISKCNFSKCIDKLSKMPNEIKYLDHIIDNNLIQIIDHDLILQIAKYYTKHSICVDIHDADYEDMLDRWGYFISFLLLLPNNIWNIELITDIRTICGFDVIPTQVKRLNSRFIISENYPEIE